jgi:CheY-like chemotaxis protein
MDVIPRILILEDMVSDADLTEFELEEAGIQFTSERVMSRKEFLRALEEFYPDLILSDYDLPQYNGALALADARGKCPDTPFILVTGAIEESKAIEILTQGAQDYVLKNQLRQRLVPAVRRALTESARRKACKMV